MPSSSERQGVYAGAQPALRLGFVAGRWFRNRPAVGAVDDVVPYQSLLGTEPPQPAPQKIIVKGAAELP